jgi:hypothetical protein
VRFSTRGVQTHQNKRFGENPYQKPLAKKVEEKKSFFLSSFVAFLAVSLHEEPKYTIKILSKIKPENL